MKQLTPHEAELALRAYYDDPRHDTLWVKLWRLWQALKRVLHG